MSGLRYFRRSQENTSNIQSPSGNRASQGTMKEPEVDPKNIIKNRDLLYRLMIRLFRIILFARALSHFASLLLMPLCNVACSHTNVILVITSSLVASPAVRESRMDDGLLLLFILLKYDTSVILIVLI